LNDRNARSSHHKNLSNACRTFLSERSASLPLSEKARVEVYLPDLPKQTYQNLLEALEEEFTYTFGGSTTIHGLDGNYLSHAGFPIRDRVNLIYTDTTFSFEENLDRLSRYTDELRKAAFEALEEEAILVVVLKVYHSE
jgi:hypothetical protein